MLIVALGIRKGRRNNCDRDNVRGKVEHSIPSRYEGNIFCAKNPTQHEATCPGDSGKYTNNSFDFFVFVITLFSH